MSILLGRNCDWKQRFLYTLFLCILLIGTTSCGFHLLGQGLGPKFLQGESIKVSLSQFDTLSAAHKALKIHLDSSKNYQLTTPELAEKNIKLLQEQIESEELTLEKSVGSTKKFMTLVWQVEVIINPNDDNLLKKNTYTLKANAINDTNADQVNATQSSEKALVQQMRKDVMNSLDYILLSS